MNKNLPSSTPNLASMQEEEKKRLLGFLFWLALIFIGSSLIFYIFVINPVGDSYSDNSGFINNTSSISKRTNHHQSAQTLRKRKNWIKYDGVLETNANIKFKLNGYDASATYLFNFGDGTSKKCKSSRITHAYTRAGKYKVRVKVSYNNKVEEAWTETLNIKKGIAVDPSAFQ